MEEEEGARREGREEERRREDSMDVDGKVVSEMWRGFWEGRELFCWGRRVRLWITWLRLRTLLPPIFQKCKYTSRMSAPCREKAKQIDLKNRK
jgi:hypothetical protein